MSTGRLTCDVIMPNRNYGAYLHEAISSALNQEGFQTHVILSDDASSDASLEVARSFAADRVTVISHAEQIGLPAARNSSIRRSTSALFGFLDSDDVWPRDRLLHLHDSLQGRTDTIATGVAVEFSGTSTHPTVERRREALRNLSCALVPRDVLTLVGSFDEGLQYGDMVDWSARAANLGVSYVMVDHVVTLRRIHDKNMSRMIASEPSDYLEIVRRYRKPRSV